jgi:predicted nucleotidyltransferase
MIPTASDIISASGFHPSRVFCIYIFGSRVYGTAASDSDWDIIMVANNSVESTELPGLKRGLYNIHVYTPKKFKEDLDWHRINNLECIFAPEWARLKEDIKWEFKLDQSKLRHAISHISSNSWVKCKKKLEQDDYYIGIKSLFHSIRIPMFGVQIASFGKIVDFSEANYIWDELTFKSEPQYMRDKFKWTWSKLDARWRPIVNGVLTQFRKLVPKG